MTDQKFPYIFVEYEFGNIFPLIIEGLNTIKDIKAKIYELEGIPPDKQCLIFDGKELHGNQTLLENRIGMESTLHLVTRITGTIRNGEGPQSAPTQPNVKPKRKYKQRKRSAPQVEVAPQQTKRPRPAPTNCMQDIATCAEPQAMPVDSTYEAKINLIALHQANVTAALSDMMPEILARPPPSVLTELEDLKREMTQKNEEFSGQRASYENQIVALKAQNRKAEEELVIAGNREKELEATISGLRHGNKMLYGQCVSYESHIVGLKAENKNTAEELTLARIKENELEATISELTHKNRTVSAQCASYGDQIVALEVDSKKTKQLLMASHSKEKEQEATISILRAQKEKSEEELTVGRNREKELEATISRLTAKCASYQNQIFSLEVDGNKTKEELIVAHNKEKEQEATISGLTHKNRVFSAQCTAYENQVTTLEVENKKIKEELVLADKKYYSAARSTGYAEGLKEGKAKWLKSVDFLHHLTDASMQYFNYGFDSCQKQAEQQGFVGQLNKDSALKEDPELKGWESCAQPDSGRNT